MFMPFPPATAFGAAVVCRLDRSQIQIDDNVNDIVILFAMSSVFLGIGALCWQRFGDGPEIEQADGGRAGGGK
jgi:hypothetical protein